MLDMVNGYRTLRFGQLLLKVGGITIGLLLALFATFRDLFFPSQDASESNSRQLHDADLVGEYNHRTGHLDAGNDPYGWYDED